MKDEKRKKNETDNNFKQCVFLDCFMRMRRKKGQSRKKDRKNDSYRNMSESNSKVQ